MYKQFRTNGSDSKQFWSGIGDPIAHITKCIELGQNSFATFTDLVKRKKNKMRSAWPDHKAIHLHGCFFSELIFGSVCMNGLLEVILGLMLLG